MNPTITKDEFCTRFKAHMLAMAPFAQFVNEDGSAGPTVAEYADEIAPTYFDDPDQVGGETPEECAEADISYWGE